jgi:hypothetical protein
MLDNNFDEFSIDIEISLNEDDIKPVLVDRSKL